MSYSTNKAVYITYQTILGLWSHCKTLYILTNETPNSCFFLSQLEETRKRKTIFAFWDWIYFWFICWYWGMLQTPVGRERTRSLQDSAFHPASAPAECTHWGKSLEFLMGNFLTWKAGIYLTWVRSVSSPYWAPRILKSEFSLLLNIHICRKKTGLAS